MEGEAAIPLETTLHAFRKKEKTKQRSSIVVTQLPDVTLATPDFKDMVEIVIYEFPQLYKWPEHIS